MSKFKNMPIIDITTKSTCDYFKYYADAIYPAFVDNTNYEAWTLDGKTDYYQLKALGGESPLNWEVIDGTLPDGITLSQDGKLSGIATKEGDFTFTVKVTDKTGKFYSKELTMTAYPYRSSWFNDAKFGLMIQWGGYTYPRLIDLPDANEILRLLDERTVNFDAEAWACKMHELGVKVVNFTTFAGDGIRMWPSTTPSIFGLSTTKDYTGELIRACKKYGIKFVAYVAGHTFWGKYIRDFDPTDKTCATLQLGLINELIDMGADGGWFDSGSTEGYTENFNWQKTVALARTKNPFFVFEVNAAPGCRGKILEYPIADAVVYEGSVTDDPDMLDIAYPNPTRKAMAIDVNNMLQTNWARQPNSHTKPATAVIENIKKNWEMGACYTMSIETPADGRLFDESCEKELTEIANWVKANRDKYTLEPHKSDFIKYDREILWHGACLRVGFDDVEVSGLKLPNTVKTCNWRIIDPSTRRWIAHGTYNGKDGKIEFEPVILKHNIQYYFLIQTPDKIQTIAGENEHFKYICDMKTDLSGTQYFYNYNECYYKTFLIIYSKAIETHTDIDKDNLLYKAKRVALMSNNDRVIKSSSGIREAENIFVDDESFFCVGGDDQWAWTYYIEFEFEHNISSLDIKFTKEMFPTKWQVLLSQDGKDYKVVAECENGAILSQFVEFDKQAVKYIKIRALKPDGPGQLGAQMAICYVNIK